MEIEIIAIGNEVLCGSVVNTNAAFISQQLSGEGFIISRHTVVPDDETLLKNTLEEALNRSPLVITTGGLGPTCDDISRKVAADLFHSPFYYNEDLALELQQRYGSKLFSIDDQATVPSKATLLKNPIGTAPGFIFHGEHSTLIMLPGVPPEMRLMLLEEVIPYLHSHYSSLFRSYARRINLFGVPESSVDPYLRQIKDEYPNITCGIYPGQGILGITLSLMAKDQESAFIQLEMPLGKIASQFPDRLFESPTGKLAPAVHQLLIESGVSLSIAESCTGGHLSAALTQFPGASNYFLGSVVCYSNDIKIDLLNVSKEVIDEYGAVSREVAREMCLGMQKKTNSDFTIAVTGIAGPTGGTPTKPIGTVWCAVGKKGFEPKIWLYQARGNREMVIERSVNALLAELYSQLKQIQQIL